VIGPLAQDLVGGSTDFGRAFPRDFFFTANLYGLDCYHVDGFRYDYVPGYWDGPVPGPDSLDKSTGCPTTESGTCLAACIELTRS
jgi:hypothetical protein